MSNFFITVHIMFDGCTENISKKIVFVPPEPKQRDEKLYAI